MTDGLAHRPAIMVRPSESGTGPWSAVAGAFAGLATGPNIVLLLVFGVFMPELRREFGWGVGETSLGATIICLTLAVVSPFQGLVVDRFGARLPILISLPVFGAGLASMALLGPDIRFFHLACGLLVIAALGAWSLSYITLVTTWFDRRLGLALGVSQLGTGLGGGVLPLLLAAIFAAAGWRTAYLVLGIVQIVVMWPIALWLAHERPFGGVARAQVVRGPGLALQQIIRERSFVPLCAAFLLLGCFSAGVIIHQVSIMLDRGMSSAVAVTLQSVLLLASMAGRLAAGWALDRFRLTLFMPLALVLTAIACGAYAGDVGLPTLLASATVMGLAIGAEFDVLGYAIRRYYGLARFGVVFGIVFGFFQVGAGVGAALVGMMRQSSGSYATGLWLLAAVSVVTAVLLAALGPYRFAAASPDLAEAAT